MSNTNCFVTGGSGFIGRNLIKALIENHYEVSALARSEASARIVSSIGATPVYGDLSNEESLASGMADADILFHLAADTNHGYMSEAQEREAIDGTRLVYDIAAKTGVKQIIHLSTEAVLLSGGPLINADESMPYPSRFPGGYSRTKAATEQIALSENSGSTKVVVMRPRFVWGRDDSTALPELVKAAHSGKLAWIDKGHYQTSTTHISNLCHAILLAIKHGKGGGIYFVSDDDDQDFRTFITKLLATQGVAAPKKAVPRFLVKLIVRVADYLTRLSAGRVMGPMSWQEYATLGDTVTLNISKAKTQLGYKPLITIEEGLSELSISSTQG